jgi:hypothetical protein
MFVNKGFGTTTPRQQDPRVQRADEQWAQQGQRTLADQDRATAQRNAGTNRADEIINRGLNAPNIATAVASSGYNPAQAQQLIASMQSAAAMAGPQSQAAGFRSSAGSFDPSSLNNFRSQNLEGLNFDQLRNYDPSEYGGQFAQGAYGEFEMNLRDQLEQLTNASAGGRMRTGWFDADRGRVVTDNAKNFSNSLMQAATTFSGQRLDALGRASDLDFRRASEIDSNSRQMTALASELGLRARTAADEVNLRAAIAGDQHALGLLAEANGMTKAAAGLAIDKLRIETQNNQFNAGQANTMATADADRGLRRDQMYGDWAMGRDDANRRDFNTSADRAAALASSNMEWSRADRDFDDKVGQRDRVNERADREFREQQFLNSSYIYTDPFTGIQRRLPGWQSPPENYRKAKGL